MLKYFYAKIKTDGTFVSKVHGNLIFIHNNLEQYTQVCNRKSDGLNNISDLHMYDVN